MPRKVAVKEAKTCLLCGKKFVPFRNNKGMYCSYKCSNGSKAVSYRRVCEYCNKEFFIKNKALINHGRYRFCSDDCRRRKYHIKHDFFDHINNESAYWLGFIWSTFHNILQQRIILCSKKELLERFNEAVGSTYPIKPFGKKYTVTITSLNLLRTLSAYGLRKDKQMEFPEVINTTYVKDFIRGYFDTDNGYIFKEPKRCVVSIRGKSSKLIKYMAEYLKATLVYDKGDWVLVSFKFKKKIMGDPHLEEKWRYFN